MTYQPLDLCLETASTGNLGLAYIKDHDRLISLSPYSQNPVCSQKGSAVGMSSKGRILCVDDHPDICDLVRTILKNYEIVFADSKAEGLRQVESGWFDLYLVDNSLPDGTGLELAILIRQFDDFTPILFISTLRSLTDRNLSEVDAQGRVSIDDLPDELLTKVSRILNQPEAT